MLVVRCQRAVFQQWKQAVPWARAGDVTVANAGDIVKERASSPRKRRRPSARRTSSSPLGPTLVLTADQVASVRTAAGAVLPALVRIVSDLGDGDAVLGSGAVIDPSGIILTNAHVVDGGEQFAVTLSDGRTVQADLLAEDALADIALLRIHAAGLHAIGIAGATHQYCPAPCSLRSATATTFRLRRRFVSVRRVARSTMPCASATSRATSSSFRGTAADHWSTFKAR